MWVWPALARRGSRGDPGERQQGQEWKVVRPGSVRRLRVPLGTLLSRRTRDSGIGGVPRGQRRQANIVNYHSWCSFHTPFTLLLNFNSKKAKTEQLPLEHLHFMCFWKYALSLIGCLCLWNGWLALGLLLYLKGEDEWVKESCMYYIH